MQEYWFCAACKSMNRAQDQRCYKCRAPKADTTLATVADRQQGVVLTPGLDEEHREVAWTLMFRQRYISAWKLGYVAAGLLFIALGAAVFATLVGVITVIRSRLDASTLDASQLVTIGAAELIFLVVLLLAAVVHSVFLYLTSMNAPALGSGSPRFDPIRAAFWWIESFLWGLRAALAFVIPPFLCLAALGLVGFALGIVGLVFGLTLGLVWAVCAFWLLGDPISSLGRPSRLLHDLWTRLGVPGSPDSRIVTIWSAAWGTGCGVGCAVSAMIYIAIIAVVLAEVAAGLFGFDIVPAPQSQIDLMAGIIDILVRVVFLAAEEIALYLLAMITIELSKRQRIREAWVLGGLADANARAYSYAAVRDANVQGGALQQTWAPVPPEQRPQPTQPAGQPAQPGLATAPASRPDFAAELSFAAWPPAGAAPVRPAAATQFEPPASSTPTTQPPTPPSASPTYGWKPVGRQIPLDSTAPGQGPADRPEAGPPASVAPPEVAADSPPDSPPDAPAGGGSAGPVDGPPDDLDLGAGI